MLKRHFISTLIVVRHRIAVFALMSKMRAGSLGLCISLIRFSSLSKHEIVLSVILALTLLVVPAFALADHDFNSGEFAWMLTASVSATGKKILMAHYMPWYESKPISGHWGWHWTMNHFNPDEVDSDGRRSIASHYYPLMGAYDSNDSDVLECQVLLMKFAGIDGIIIDWYGIEDFYDYAMIHRNTTHIIEYIQKAGLKFSICYEDVTIKTMIRDGPFYYEEHAVWYGQKVMQFLQDNWFDTEEYLKVDDRPTLFVFGPQFFQANQWNELFSILPKRPFFYTLNRIKEGADGSFGWPPMRGGVTTPSQWRTYLERLYNRIEDGKTIVGAVFPKFHDIYQDAGIRNSYGFLDDQDGKTFADTLDMGFYSKAKIIQLVTWNDYGEGTIIEPSVETGYRYLEMIQARRRTAIGQSFKYSATDLRLPVDLYILKKKYKDNPFVIKNLDEVSDLLFSGHLSRARQVLKPYQQLDAINPEDVNSDGVIDIADLVMVSMQFGQTPPENPAADVNRDGTVDIYDLVKVGKRLGEKIAASAPGRMWGNLSGLSQNQQLDSLPQSGITAIQSALAELEMLADPSLPAITARDLLHAWLMRRQSDLAETKLLPNYPNPFNPETWIPYQLASDTAVEIAIYDVHGSLVRRLKLGNQEAGYYIDRDRAAYWNGRSVTGKSVSSGQYFYQLHAGDFTSVKRMIIVK